MKIKQDSLDKPAPAVWHSQNTPERLSHQGPEPLEMS